MARRRAWKSLMVDYYLGADLLAVLTLNGRASLSYMILVLLLQVLSISVYYDVFWPPILL